MQNYAVRYETHPHGCSITADFEETIPVLTKVHLYAMKKSRATEFPSFMVTTYVDVKNGITVQVNQEMYE